MLNCQTLGHYDLVGHQYCPAVRILHCHYFQEKQSQKTHGDHHLVFVRYFQHLLFAILVREQMMMQPAFEKETLVLGYLEVE